MLVEHTTCPACGRAYDPLRARAIRVVDGKVRAFCSTDCRDRGVVTLAIDESEDEPPPPRRRYTTELAVGGAVFVVLALGVGSRLFKKAPVLPAAIAPAIAIVHPPTTPTQAMAMLSETETDRWIHPLLGPRRHLPLRDSRRFGAAREGMRPEECAGGHCGVDLGSEKGDLVMAAHDGVVERVERDPEVGGRRGNEGRFVRISHKGGTVVTSYIHLDGIREDLKPGIPVKAGEVIGTVGDTGVKASGPHLHFAVSVRADANAEELYIDPEPMLHLWPLQAHPVSSLHAMEPPPRPHPKTAQAAAAPTL